MPWGFIRMFIRGMFRGAASQSSVGQQKAAEDYLANHPVMRRIAQLSVYNWLKTKDLINSTKRTSLNEIKKRINDK